MRMPLAAFSCTQCLGMLCSQLVSLCEDSRRCSACAKRCSHSFCFSSRSCTRQQGEWIHAG